VKYFAALFCLLVFCRVACNEKPMKTDEEKNREIILANHIATITEYRTNINAGIEEREQAVQVSSYNEKGLKTKEVNYAGDGIIDFVYLYEYDADDRLATITGADKDNRLTSTVKQSYDKNHRLHELYYYLPGGTYKYRNIRTYDAKGRLKELAWYWMTGFKSKNVYDWDGVKKVSDTEYSSIGAKTYEWNYRYDGSGNMIEAVQYYPGNIRTKRTLYEYNRLNQMVKQTNYQGELLINSIAFRYDSRDMLISKTEYSSSGKPIGVTRYVFE
jgi:hypothetical protein